MKTTYFITGLIWLWSGTPASTCSLLSVGIITDFVRLDQELQPGWPRCRHV